MTAAEDVIALTKALIAINTVDPPGNEDEAAHVVVNVLASHGIDAVLRPIAPGRSNLVARLNGSGEKPALSMSAHFDTIGIDPAAWTRDPFAPAIENGLLYGRGSTDMKSGLAAMTMAMVALKHAKTSLRGDLLLTFTAAENSNLLGAREMVRTGVFKGVGALLNSEPSSMRVFVSEKGTLWLRATAQGDSGHAAFREGEAGDRGNAIVRLARFVDRLQSLDLQAPPHRHLKPPTINVGLISGGVSTPMTAPSASCDIDVRVVPGLEPEQVMARIAVMAGPHVALERLDYKPPVDTADDHPFVDLCRAALRDRTGYNGPPEGIAYYSDCAAIAPVLNLPMVIIGPGEAGHSGRPDEYCKVKNIVDAVGVYRRVAERYLG
jgi:succinyl-diaminopimelate desuccinylase